MDNTKMGHLLYHLRKEKGMTQKQIADLMNISDKTVSKWERGLGCPDVSLLTKLSKILGVNIEKILSGDLDTNNIETGNLKRIKFNVCPACTNVIYSLGEAEISCCSRRLSPLTAKPADDYHTVAVEELEGEYYVTFHHEMKKEHFISFAAYVTSDRFLLIKLYPEQASSLRIPKLNGGKLLQKYGGKLYYYCSQHGLWVI